LTAESDKATYSFNLLGAKPEPGAYVAELRVTPKAETDKWIPVEGAHRHVKVVTSIELADAELVVTNSKDIDEDVVDRIALEVGKKHKKEVTIAAGKHLFLTFRLKNKVSGKNLQVQQAFVTFTDATSKQDVFFVVPVDTAKKVYKLHVDLAKFKGPSGVYSLRVLIGDPSIDNSFEWDAASVSFKFASEAAQSHPSIYDAKPEIHHIFRKPDSRPPRTVSQAFTLLALAPIALLIVGWLIVGINFGNFPSGIAAIYALLFHVALIATLGVLGLFWLELTIFDTLKYLGYAGVPLLFFGQQTFRALATQKPKQD